MGAVRRRRSGATYRSGDADVGFPIMSVAKPFVFALACDLLGAEAGSDVVGVEATGLPRELGLDLFWSAPTV
jgi:glutaminase